MLVTRSKGEKVRTLSWYERPRAHYEVTLGAVEVKRRAHVEESVAERCACWYPPARLVHQHLLRGLRSAHKQRGAQKAGPHTGE